MTAAEAEAVLLRFIAERRLNIPIDWPEVRRGGVDGLHDTAAAAFVFGLRLLNRADPEISNAGGLIATLATENLRFQETVTELATALEKLATTVLELPEKPPAAVLRLEMAPTRRVVERNGSGDITAIHELPA